MNAKQPQQQTDERLIDEREAAAFLGLSTCTLRNDRLSARRIPFVKIGRAVRYRPSRLREFVEQSELGVPA